MQVTEQSPIAAGEFERVLDARLIMSVVAAGIMSFADVVVETAMNVTFPRSWMNSGSTQRPSSG